MMRKLALLLTAFFLPVFTAQAELCPSNGIDIQESTPTSRFTIVDEAGQVNPGAGQLVIDNETGLMWDRCQWGRAWNPGTLKCEINVNHSGSSYTPNWIESLSIVNDDITETSPYLGKSDWRLPNIKELASIVERKCYEPSINDEVFRTTSPGVFWSNTHVAGSVVMRVVNFSNGLVAASEIDPPSDYRTYLRLVRDVLPDE